MSDCFIQIMEIIEVGKRIMCEHCPWKCKENGYDGVLIPNHSMTIRFKGERVFATYSPTPKNYDELMDVLETMPQFMDMLNEQVKNAISKGARA